MADLPPYYAAIEAALIGDGTAPTVADLSDCRFYADQMPSDPELPGIRYALLLDDPHQRLSSGNSTTAEIQVDVYAHRADAAVAWRIDAAVRRVLDRQNLTAEGFASVQAVCVARGVPFAEPGYYRIRSRYRLFGSAA